MRIITVLDFRCKKKHAFGVMKILSAFCCPVFVFALIALFPRPAAAAREGNVIMTTPGGKESGAVIGTDSATGSRVMKTPDPKPKEESQGPRTIIVAPEVYPDRQGSRPGRPGRQ